MFRVNQVIRKNPFINPHQTLPRFDQGSTLNAEKEPLTSIEYLKKWLNEQNNNSKYCPKWDLSKIPLKYYIGTPSPIISEQSINSINLSFDKWSSASAGLIRFYRTYNHNTADILIEWSDSPINGRPFEVGHNNLKTKGNKIEKAYITIVVNPLIDNYVNSFNKDERIKRTILHEIGHALGLNHSNSPKDVMHHRGIKNKTLSSNDIRRINELYTSKNPDFII